MNHRFVYYPGRFSLIALASLLVSCSSVPKPAVPDGSARKPVNDTARLTAFKESVAQDRTTLTENNLLRAHVDMLRAQIDELRTIVREALLLPPAAPVNAPAASGPVAPLVVKPAAQTNSFEPQAGPALVDALPSHVFETSSTGVVIRVFHGFAQTQFKPNEQVAMLLKHYSTSADAILIRAMTDSAVINPGDRAVASARAARAFNWLVSNGTKPSRIRSEYFTAGHFLVDNSSRDGRALNRRVEIEFRGGLASVSPPFVAAETIIVRGDPLS
jgi:outer membrane protein OmpA-like peptidoglycan-associated protein